MAEPAVLTLQMVLYDESIVAGPSRHDQVDSTRPERDEAGHHRLEGQ